jgi:hypothetical protein
MSREVYTLCALGLPNPIAHPQFPERVTPLSGGMLPKKELHGLDLAIDAHERETAGDPAYGKPTALSSNKRPFNASGLTGLNLAIAAHEAETANDPAYAMGSNSTRPVALSAEANAKLIVDILRQYPRISGADLMTTFRRLQSGRPL